MYKSAKSTSQKQKSQDRSKSKVSSEGIELSYDFDECLKSGVITKVDGRLVTIYQREKLHNSARESTFWANALKAQEPLMLSQVTSTGGVFGVLNEGLKIYSNLTAHVSFNNTLNRWIAICEQLKITTHAEDMESVVLKLEKLLNRNEKVSENYHLTVNFTKFISKVKSTSEVPARSLFSNPNHNYYLYELEPVSSKVKDALSSRNLPILNFPHDLHHAHKEAAIKAAKEMLSSLRSKKVEEINEFPHIDIDKLARLAEEVSYTMPRGLTREQIIEWARKNQK